MKPTYIVESRKDYKQKLGNHIMFVMQKRGQIALYVIIAIIIVAAILVIFLVPNLRTNITGGEFSPVSYLKGCIGPEVNSNIELLAKQGGYINPEGFILHEGTKIKYLCYTAKDYETCVVQQPMIKNHFEKELNSILEARANNCARNLKVEYEKRGYSVSSSSVESQVSIIPSKIRIDFLTPMTITKESTSTYKGFEVEIPSEMYELLLTAQSIIDYESTYGDSETTIYMNYYHDLKVEKLKQTDGSTIYILTDRNTNNKFQFASRSIAWPPGIIRD